MNENAWKCYNCLKVIDEIPTFAMNLPDVTPGPVRFCSDCCDSASVTTIIEQIDSFLNPPREREVK